MSKEDTVEEQPVESLEDAIAGAFDLADKEDDEEVAEIAELEEDTDEPEDDAEETDSESEQDLAEADEEEPEEKLEAPQHWAASDREIFNGQSKEAQQFLLNRHKAMEGDYTRKMQEFAPEKRQFDAIKDSLEPYKHDFQRAGLDYAGAVRQLASWDNALRTGGRDAVYQLAHTYGIDMAAPESEEYIDPQVKQLQNQLRELKQVQSQQTQQAQQQKQNQILETIQAFSSETSADGNLAHPHFEVLKDDIARLFNAGLVADLKEGYTKALALRPDLAAPKEPARKVAEKPNRAEIVRKAKKAAAGVKSSGAVGKKVRDTMSLEQEIASHF